MAQVKMKGIDVSYWQGTPDETEYKKFKQGGWDFIVARIGYADGGVLNKDTTFDHNEKQCKKQKLKFGAYFYSNAKNAQDGRKDAEYVMKLLNGRKLDLPVWIDMEDNDTSGKATKRNLAEACKEFCQTMEDGGYMAGVYASLYWFGAKIGDLGNLRKWCAQYNDQLTYDKDVDIWQYSSTITVPGFSGRRDANHCYASYGKTDIVDSVFPNLPLRGYFLKDDKGIQVEKLQQLLNGIMATKLNTDGILGEKTIAVIKNYQKKYSLTIDGRFGYQSLAKAKIVRK